jgi:hypothetical protein
LTSVVDAAVNVDRESNRIRYLTAVHFVLIKY